MSGSNTVTICLKCLDIQSLRDDDFIQWITL